MSTRRSNRLSGDNEGLIGSGQVETMDVGADFGITKSRRRDGESMYAIEPEKKRRKMQTKKTSAFKPQPVAIPNSSDTPPEDDMDLPPPPSEKKPARRRESTRALRERPRSPSPTQISHPKQPTSSRTNALHQSSSTNSTRPHGYRAGPPQNALDPHSTSRPSMGPPTIPFIRKTRKSMAGLLDPTIDSVVPIPENETPMIRKNKDMRQAQSRRSSLNNRGQRASSSLGRGDISIPHASVDSSTFYTHISSTIPEPIRARHLLLWCLTRATDAALLPVSKSRSKGKSKDDSLRTEQGDKLVKEVMNDLMAKLGRGVVDTNVFQQGETSGSSSGLRPHPQNVSNLEVEKKENAVIKIARDEVSEWGTLSSRARHRQNKTLAAFEQKQKGETHDLPDLSTAEPWMRDALKLAEDVIAEGDGDLSAVGEFADVEYKIDTLHQSTHAALQYSLQASRFLDGIFASLSADLSQRGLRPSLATDSDSPDLVSLLASTKHSSVTSTSAAESSSRSKPDPIHMLRALARAELNTGSGPSEETLAKVAAIPPVPNPSATSLLSTTTIPNTALSSSVSAVLNASTAMTPRRVGMTPRRGVVGLTPKSRGGGGLGSSTSTIPTGQNHLQGTTSTATE